MSSHLVLPVNTPVTIFDQVHVRGRGSLNFRFEEAPITSLSVFGVQTFIDKCDEADPGNPKYSLWEGYGFEVIQGDSMGYPADNYGWTNLVSNDDWEGGVVTTSFPLGGYGRFRLDWDVFPSAKGRYSLTVLALA
jgi:hypothetical protein